MSRVCRLSLPFESGEITLPVNGSVLALRAQLCDFYFRLDKTKFSFEQGFRPQYDLLCQAGFAPVGVLAPEYDLIIVHLTRVRAENLGMIAKACRLAGSCGTVMVDGAKTDGVEAALKAVKAHFAVQGQLSKSHGKVFWLQPAENLPPEIATWEAALSPSQNRDGFITAPGVFSAEKIDRGSALLANFLKGRLKGNGADLGAGWGWLSHVALEKNPKITHLTLYEAEAIGLMAAKQNINDARADFEWQDVTKLHPGAAFDFVIANPPFHQGRQAEPDLGRRFIEKAAEILTSSGQLLMVANRQLPYEKQMGQSFRRWEMLTQNAQYKVLHARKPFKQK